MQKHPIEHKRFNTFLPTYQIKWLKQTALDESNRRSYDVTAAQVLREIIDEKISPSQP